MDGRSWAGVMEGVMALGIESWRRDAKLLMCVVGVFGLRKERSGRALRSWWL
jgi:hypothetical protein